MGNLIPLGMALPFAVVGVHQVLNGGPLLGTPLLWIGAMPVVAWLGVNVFGLYQNEAMRDAMQRRLGQMEIDLGESRSFVGFSRPGKSGLLDAHEDVGYLLVRAEEIEFVGESHRVALPRSAVTGVRFRPNIHSLVGLGRWIAVEGVLAGKNVRLLVEPRERSSMLANRRYGTQLRKELDAWAKGS